VLDVSGGAGLRHNDHEIVDFSNEFVWLRDQRKPFYVFADDGSGRIEEVRGDSAWFDARYEHQAGIPVILDGDEALSEEERKLSLSIRIDGRFTERFVKWKRPAERW